MQLKNEVLGALLREISITPGKSEQLIETIYFGGGTPSLLDPAELGSILNCIRQEFSIASGAEITLEANPDDINPEIAEAWLNMGVNRLSIGVQSFHDEDLRWMNRAHDAAQAEIAISTIRQSGFSNFSIDLIFGSPATSMEQWKENLSRVAELKIPHISAYALTVEPGTALDLMIRKNKKEDTDPDVQANQYLTLMDTLIGEGYEHYEISSFCLPGKRSRHNSAYWKGIPYFGFGPAAHSFDGQSRKWNIASNPAYIRSIAEGIIPCEIEQLSDTKRVNEYIMTSLRTSEGIDLDTIKNSWGNEYAETIEEGLNIYIKRDQVLHSGSRYRLTREGKLFADGIASALFFSE